MKTLIITGASGLLGQYLCKYFASKYRVIGTYCMNRPQLENVELEMLNLNQSELVESLFQKYSPNFIINTAGLTSVDDCELNPQLAHQLNVSIPENIVNALGTSNTKFIQLSTDHLYSDQGTNYSEECPETPINVYAKTKLAGDLVTLKYPNNLVIRTNFYGGQTKYKFSFSNWIQFKLNQKEPFRAVSDVFYTPMSVCGLAFNLELAMISNLTGKFNIVGTERVSKYDFAVALAEAYQMPVHQIIKTNLNSLSLIAPRPFDMSLSTEKMRTQLPGYKPESIREGLEKIRMEGLI